MSARPTIQRQKFEGFLHLDANYIYCPNQFFDVCLRRCSLNAVRIVAYVLYQTLGWLDHNGNPRQQDVTVPFRELITKAGLSRGAIRPAIDEAVAARLIACTHRGRAKAPGQRSQSARYRLQWHDDDAYTTNADAFQGFYTGEGCRTPIPNAFFTSVIPHERLAVIKVVGSVLRHTVGYRNQFGGQRTDAPLPYTFIQDYANIKNRTTLNDAIQHAIRAGYIVRTHDGVFSPNAEVRRPAEYAVKWFGETNVDDIGSENVPEASDQYRNRTSIGSRTRPADRFSKRTNIKTGFKDSFKQQDVPPVAAGISKAKQLLLDAGFDPRTAVGLSESRGLSEIEQQIAWLEYRQPADNPLGMLRRAIEDEWPEPVEAIRKRNQQNDTHRERKVAAERSARNRQLRRDEKQKRQDRTQRLKEWDALSDRDKANCFTQAIERTSSPSTRAYLKRHQNFTNPPSFVLAIADSKIDTR